MILYLPLILTFSLLIFLIYFVYYQRKKEREVSLVVRDLKNQQKTLNTLWQIEQIIVNTLDFQDVAQKIADAVLLELGKYKFAIIVLSLIDSEKTNLRRISISQTKEAELALKLTPIPFHDINIPLSATDNLCVRAVNEKKYFITEHMSDVLYPAIDRNFVEKAQIALGVQTTIVYPVISRNRVLGSLIFSIKKEQKDISAYEYDIIRGFTDAVGIALDNSLLYMDLKRVTEELASANKKLQALDKLKDEFVSLAAHELRSPMTTIKGSLSTILDGYAGEISDQTREFLTASYNENDRLIRLVNNFLNISRIEAGTFNVVVTKVSMSKLINEVVHNLQISAKEKNLFLNFEQTGVIPLVYADGDKIKEVLINLIGNALKFTRKGGVTIRVKVEKGMLNTSVSDTGSGIVKEDQELLFKKFSQGKNYAKQAGGTGLGLYICKQIIEKLNGKVWLESTLGKGSTFFFSLPLAGEKEMTNN